MGSVPSCTEVCTPAIKRCSVGSTGLSDSGVFEVYEIGEILGSGAFGQVRACWLAGEIDDGAYAVKVIDLQDSSQQFAGAAREMPASEEASILQSVRHPHIVELVDIFVEEHWLFVVEERIVGGELFASLADKHHNLVESCVAVVGCQLLQALQYLHGCCIVHRDVKAENILLASLPAASGRWDVKLVDFGLACRLEQQPLFLRSCRHQTADMPYDDVICGTAYYCAPEVWAGGYGPKVDVFAAAVVMYLALFGIYPFYDKDPNMIEALICNEGVEPNWRHECIKQCPSYLPSQAARECLANLLEKDPARRASAGKAIKDPWLRRARVLQRSKKPLPADGAQPAAIEDPVIPLPVRLKAGRAAARPLVNAAKEDARTAALEALKSRASSPGRLSSRSKPHPSSCIPAAQPASRSRPLIARLGSIDTSATAFHITSNEETEIDESDEGEGEQILCY